MSRHPPLPLRWYIAKARLVAARVLERAGPSLASHALLLVAIALAVNLARQDLPATIGGRPASQAIAAWVIQIIIMAVVAILSYALRPKPKDPEAVKGTIPTAEDGKGIIIVSGTVWIDDSIVLGFKQLGTTKIKSKGGKKG